MNRPPAIAEPGEIDRQADAAQRAEQRPEAGKIGDRVAPQVETSLRSIANRPSRKPPITVAAG